MDSCYLERHDFDYFGPIALAFSSSIHLAHLARGMVSISIHEHLLLLELEMSQLPSQARWTLELQLRAFVTFC
jgi:hypothetical protein